MLVMSMVMSIPYVIYPHAREHHAHARARLPSLKGRVKKVLELK